MGLSVIGAGFGRTGTLSLKGALETLGYDRCYHMNEVLEHPQHDAAWARALEQESMDWDALFEGFRAAVDWPACHFWRELSAHYPQAKVILTVRDPERWYQSVHDTLYQILKIPPAEAAPEFRVHRAMTRRLVLDLTFDWRFEDRTYAIERYERHNQTVRDAFSSARLLEYEVSEGWEPLCEFLGCETPAVDFPRVNSAEEFQHLHLRSS
jgi:hypothetical protein